MKHFSSEFGFELIYFKGGGGGSSGDVDYPDYMKTYHGRMLDNSGADSPTHSLVDAINSAYGNSPFATAVAYDPDTDITAFETAISDFDAIIAAIDEEGDWDGLYTQAGTSIDAEIDDDIDAFADQLDDEITTKVLPRFEAGMRDINAVVSSAFVLGRSNIEGFRDREVARHSSKIRLAAQDLYLKATDQILRLLLSKYGWEEAYMRAVVEGRRIKIVAKKEETDVNLDIDESDALWDLELFQHGGNLLASIGSGVVSTKKQTRSAISSALGGAMAGAASGAMVGSVVPGIGTGIGAIAGGVLGAAASLSE